MRKSKLLEKDLIGKRFNKIVILKCEGLKQVGKSRRTLWACKCDCGKEFKSTIYDFIRGHKKSCGCYLYATGANSPQWRGFGDISKNDWTGLKRGAKDRNLIFNISIEYAWELFKQQNNKCSLSDILLEFSTVSKEHEQTASLDRIDSSQGYIRGNVQWVHKHINVMKQDMSDDTFIWWCKKVASFKISP
jgi:hypothetical protein